MKFYFLPLVLLLLFGIKTSCQNSEMKKNGPVTKLYDNGKKRFEGQFRDGVPFGKFIYYYKTGQLQAEMNYSDDGIIATSTTYYENGNKMAEGKFINQKKEGKWEYYLNEKDNNIISYEHYRNGKLDGEMVTYYPNSMVPAEIVHFKEGFKDGKLLKFFSDSTIMTESYYTDNQPDSLFLHYHPDGSIYIKGYYNKGIQIGNWEYFNAEGKPISEEDFLRQEEVGDDSQ